MLLFQFESSFPWKWMEKHNLEKNEWQQSTSVQRNDEENRFNADSWCNIFLQLMNCNRNTELINLMMPNSQHGILASFLQFRNEHNSCSLAFVSHHTGELWLNLWWSVLLSCIVTFLQFSGRGRISILSKLYQNMCLWQKQRKVLGHYLFLSEETAVAAPMFLLLLLLLLCL